MFSVYIYVTHKNICDSCRFSLLSFVLSFLPLLFLSQSLVFVAVVFIVFIILLLVCQYSASCLIVFSASFVSCSRCYWDFFHDNSYLSIEYNNWVPLIDLTVSNNTSSRRTYRKRYIDNFNPLLKKNFRYMREVNKLTLGTIYHILPQTLILMRYIRLLFIIGACLNDRCL